MRYKLSLGPSFFLNLYNFLYLLMFIRFLPICEGSIVYLQPSQQLTECDVGSKMTLRCNVSDLAQSHIVWLKDGHTLTDDLSWIVSEQRVGLISEGVTAQDSGDYACIIDPDNDILSGREITTRDLKTQELNTQLIVRTPPGKLENVTVHASTIIATIHWHVNNDGGYPISGFTLLYLHDMGNVTNDTNWQVPTSLHISPAVRQVFVYHLQPSTDYMFRIWANNKLGHGESTVIYTTTASPLDAPDVLRQMLHGGDMDDFSSTAWMIAVSMVLGTVLILSCLSCILIYKEGRNGFPEEDEDSMPHIITNPGFEIDLEDSVLLDHTDLNSNREIAQRTNNNTVVLPSRV